MKISPALLRGLFAGALVAPSALFAQNTVVWNGAAVGTWNNSGGGWSGGFPPSNTTSVQIDQNVNQDSDVTLTVNSNIMNLTVDAGDTLRMSGGVQLGIVGAPPALTADQISIDGLLDMTEGGPNKLYITVSNTFRYGAGEVRLRGQAQIEGPGIYYQQSGSTTGSGIIGGNNMGVNNEGTIAATFASETLDILGVARADMGNKIDNHGTLEASNGGKLRLTMSGSGYLDNSGGTIRANNGSTVQLYGIPVSGGILTSAGTGSISVLGRNQNGWDSLINQGLAEVLDGSILYLGAGVVNEGTIRSNAITLGGDGIQISGNLTLDGGGKLAMGLNSPTASDGAISGSGSTLTLGNQTVEGRGNLGQDSLVVIVSPAGKVNANLAGGTLQINPPAAGFTNQGILQAENAGTLILFGNPSEVFTNTGGVIQALAGSVVTLSGAIQGGVLKTFGDGVVRCISSGSVVDVTNEGTLEVSGNLYVGGTLTNSGVIGPVTNAVQISGSVTLGGGGTVKLGPGFGQLVGDGSRLTIGSQRIEGTGIVGGGTNANFTNSSNGVISANVSGGGLQVRSSFDVSVNDGVFRAENGGIFQFTSGSFTIGSTGRVEVLDGSQITPGGGALTNRLGGGILSGGNYLVRGITATATMALPGGNIVGNDSNITLDGTLSTWSQLDTLTSNSGRLALAGSRDFSTSGAFANTGTLALGPGSVFTSTQSFNQTGGGTTDVTISGDPSSAENYGQLVINAASTLGGVLHVHFDRTGGFIPLSGQTWRVVAGNSLTGNFTSVSITGLPLTLQGSVNYVSGGGVDITLTNQASYGYAQWASNIPFVLPADSLPGSDPDNDGIVNQIEFGFQMDPLVSDITIMPSPQLAAGQLTASFSQPSGITGVLYGAEVSDNLTTWTPVTDTGSGGSHFFTVPVGSDPRKFMHLSITLTP